MIVAEPVVAKKLRIKFASQSVDAVPAINAFGSVNNADGKCQSVVYDLQRKKQNFTERSTVKRGLSGMEESQPQKRRKMNRAVVHQCISLVKLLGSHSYGWVFKKPVDPVALNIPDYFSIITNPMDLGTVRSKLENDQYFGTEEFASDVRLTFSNAMLYNPPINNVYKMAEKMKEIFEIKWKALEENWSHQIPKGGDQHPFRAKAKKFGGTKQNCPQTSPLRDALSPAKSKSLKNSSNVRTKKVKLSKPVDICNGKVLHQISYRGTDNAGRRACGSANAKQSSSPVDSKCGTCRISVCQCVLSSNSGYSSSDMSSERSYGRDHNADSSDQSKLADQGKHMLISQMSESHPHSDGSVSALDEENLQSSVRMTPATEAKSGEAWRPPVFDVQLSPTKALRAAMLKRRFADTILRARHKALLDIGDKADPVQRQQEKQRLEKKQLEEKTWMEAQIRADEAASRKREVIELKKRVKEREAARFALQQMEKTAEIEQNLEIVKELEKLSGCSLSYSYSFGRKGAEVAGRRARSWSPLEQLGLFMKDDSMDEDGI